jgi:hypothetical protein
VKVFARNFTHVMPVKELTDPGGLATVMVVALPVFPSTFGLSVVAGFVVIGDCLAGLDWTGVATDRTGVDAGTGGSGTGATG